MVRRFDHIDMRVSDMTLAQPFYERLLPLLGFTRDDSGEGWLQRMSGDSEEAAEFFGVIESKGHRPNENRVAFWASTVAEVDRLSTHLDDIGARNVEGPGWEDPHYYAVFFEDPDGNRLEIVHRTADKP